MKKTLALLFVFAAVFANSASLTSEWKARYDSVLKLMTSRNATAFKALFAPDFVWVDPKGKTETREQAMKELDEMFSATKITGRMKLGKVTARGDLVDVVFDLHVVQTMKGMGKMSVHEKGVDTWKKIDGKWMFVKTVDSVMTATPAK
jgi:ketosteroid isomerase-like protein